MNYDNVLYQNHVDILCLSDKLMIHSRLNFFDILCVMVRMILSSFRLMGRIFEGLLLVGVRVEGFFICTFSLTLLGTSFSTHPTESISPTTMS